MFVTGVDFIHESVNHLARNSQKSERKVSAEDFPDRAFQGRLGFSMSDDPNVLAFGGYESVGFGCLSANMDEVAGGKGRIDVIAFLLQRKIGVVGLGDESPDMRGASADDFGIKAKGDIGRPVVAKAGKKFVCRSYSPSSLSSANERWEGQGEGEDKFHPWYSIIKARLAPRPLLGAWARE